MSVVARNEDSIISKYNSSNPQILRADAYSLTKELSVNIESILVKFQNVEIFNVIRQAS